MIVPDVNILVHAHRVEMPHHQACRRLLDEQGATEGLGLPETSILGFVRIVTHPQIFTTPTSLSVALASVEEWLSRETYLRLSPGYEYQGIFAQLCREIQPTGNDIYDAHLAALAIEHRSELWSLDRGFARFPRLRWRSPA